MGLSPAVLNRLLVTERPEAADGTITEVDDETPFEFEFEVDSPNAAVGAVPSPKEILLDPVFDDDDELPEMHQPQPHTFRVRMLSESGAQHASSPGSPAPLNVTEMLRARDMSPATANGHGLRDASPGGSDRRVVKRGINDGVTAEYVFAGENLHCQTDVRRRFPTATSHQAHGAECSLAHSTTNVHHRYRRHG